MTLLVATTNEAKLQEIRALLSGLPIELVGLADLPPVVEPEETGITFQENAALKARYYAAHSQLLTVAEDSGLVIDALDGEPGVRSARFLRPDASYEERFAEICRRLAGRPTAPRSARFVCALALADGTRERDGDRDGVIFQTTGVIEGEVAKTPSGNRGFGYDPIFYYPPYGRTLAEVTEEAKLRVAHRGQAFRHLAEWLSRRDRAPAP